MTVINWTSIKPSVQNTALGIQGLACSGDGTMVVMACYTDSAYLSTNSGSTWASIKGKDNYTCAAMDITGKKILLGTGATGALNYSLNSGGSWTGSGIAGAYGYCCISGNGKVFYATNSGTHGVIQSVNTGSSWATLTNSPAMSGGSIACNFDGSIVVAAVNGGRIYVSTDSGATWPEVRPNGDASYAWQDVAINYDGTKMYAIVVGGRVWMSSGTGATGTWSETRPNGNANFNWTFCACSFNGSTVLLQASASRCWISINSGLTWSETQPVGNTDQYWGNYGFVSPYGEVFAVMITPPTDPTVCYYSNYRENLSAPIFLS